MWQVSHYSLVQTKLLYARDSGAGPSVGIFTIPFFPCINYIRSLDRLAAWFTHLNYMPVSGVNISICALLLTQSNIIYHRVLYKIHWLCFKSTLTTIITYYWKMKTQFSLSYQSCPNLESLCMNPIWFSDSVPCCTGIWTVWFSSFNWRQRELMIC